MKKQLFILLSIPSCSLLYVFYCLHVFLILKDQNYLGIMIQKQLPKELTFDYFQLIYYVQTNLFGCWSFQKHKTANSSLDQTVWVIFNNLAVTHSNTTSKISQKIDIYTVNDYVIPSTSSVPQLSPMFAKAARRARVQSLVNVWTETNNRRGRSQQYLQLYVSMMDSVLTKTTVTDAFRNNLYFSP